MRIAFMGTPDFAVPALGVLAAQGHDIAAVYTRAPRPAGRGLGVRGTPVQALAERLCVPVLTPATLRTAEAAAAFRAHAADVAVVVAYGLLLPAPFLEAPRFGCLNLHASLLPRWRGAAPIQRAVMAGDAETGVTVMRMDAGLDTGPVASMRRLAIAPAWTAGDVHDRLAAMGADLLAEALAGLASGSLRFQAQPAEGVVYAHKISKAECRIDWRRPAAAVHDHVRGLSPFPGAFFEADFGRGPERVKVLRCRPADGCGPPGSVLDAAATVACGSDAVALDELQRAGRAPLHADAFLRGTPLPAGTMLQ